MAPKRLFIDLTNDLDDATKKKRQVIIDLTNDLDDATEGKRQVIDNEQSNHHNVPSGEDVLRVTAGKAAYDVTCSEVFGDNAANPLCHDSSQSLDKDNPSPSLVCFGSLCNLKLRIFAHESILKKSGLLADQVDPTHVSLTHKNGQDIVCYNATHIGVMSANASNTLSLLRSYPTVQYVIDTSSLELNNWVSAWRKKRKGPDLCLEIIIYGDLDVKAGLGEALSNARLYLQHPISPPKGVVLENPHMLQFPDLSDNEDENPNEAESGISMISDATKIDASIFLEHLEQSEHCDAAIPAAKVKTSLLDHQRRAINFILHRESDNNHQALSLWMNGTASNGLYTSCIHKVTKRSSSRPKELFGGIIADEMGLGKTLTVLASVSASREGAYNHMRSYKPTKAVPLSSRATLVVVPSTLLLDNWTSEIARHFSPEIFSVYQYHGSQKEKEPNRISDHDIVLTTYATLTAQFSGSQPLHLISWYRIVLDEAHQIRNQNTRIFRAITCLSGRSRWCVTGTPIQNSLEDLGALTRFLQVPLLTSSRDFKVHCINPVLNKGAEGFGNIRTLLRLICIRRTKELLELPKFHAVEYRLSLSVQENTRYQDISHAYKVAIDDAICGRRPADAYRFIFRALLDLRMLCNQGSRTMTEEMKDYLSLSQNGSMQCAYCEGNVYDEDNSEAGLAAIFAICDHVVCSQCVTLALTDEKKVESGDRIDCPQCSKPLQPSDGKPAIRFIKNMDSQAIEETSTSTKFSAITEDVRKFCNTDKCIIFSYWRQSLQKLAGMLKKANIRFVILEGSLNLSQRRSVLELFKSHADIPVLLMTLGTGAVGLNLTIANRIYLMEPQWNPTVETQAIGRALRFGQEKQVTIIRYIMNNTVEEYIQTRQRHKLQLANLGLGTSSGRADTEESLERAKGLRDAIGL